MKPFVLSLSKHERLFANLRQFHLPLRKLALSVARADKAIVNRLLALVTWSNPCDEYACRL